MKRRIALLLVMTATLSVAACKAPGIPIDLGDCILKSCHWYSNESLFLVATGSGEERWLRLSSYSLSAQKDRVLFTGGLHAESFSSSVVDTDKLLGFQNTNAALLFDKGTLNPVDEIGKSERDITMCLSPSTRFTAHMREDGLFISDTLTHQERQLSDSMHSYTSLAWSDDERRILYIGDGYESISLVDLETGEAHSFSAADLPLHSRFVHLVWCRFLPGTYDVLAYVVCADGEAFTVFGTGTDRWSHTIEETGSIDVFAVHEGSVLYAHNKPHAQGTELVIYDYATDVLRVLHSAGTPVLGADFSPDGSRVAFITYQAGKQILRQIPKMP